MAKILPHASQLPQLQIRPSGVLKVNREQAPSALIAAAPHSPLQMRKHRPAQGPMIVDSKTVVVQPQDPILFDRGSAQGPFTVPSPIPPPVGVPTDPAPMWWETGQGMPLDRRFEYGSTRFYVPTPAAVQAQGKGDVNRWEDVGWPTGGMTPCGPKWSDVVGAGIFSNQPWRYNGIFQTDYAYPGYMAREPDEGWWLSEGKDAHTGAPIWVTTLSGLGGIVDQIREPVSIAGIEIPRWALALGAAVVGFVAVRQFKANKRKKARRSRRARRSGR